MVVATVRYAEKVWERSRIETVQDFLIKLDIKPLKHLLEISIFSLNFRHIETLNFEIFCKVVHNFGKSDNVII